MKKFSTIAMLFITTLLLLFFIVGCSSDSNSGSTGSSTGNTSGEGASQEQQSADAPAGSSEQTIAPSTDSDTSTSTDTGTADAASDEEKPTVYEAVIPEETQNVMNNLTGTWMSQTPLEDGSQSIVRVKIDNVSGFTITTGTLAPDGSATYYSRMGSYEVEGNTITFSATTGGEHHEIDDYTFRTGMDPGVFQYTFEENPEMTQLVLTPVNEKAQQLTGAGPLTLAKS